jgi:hypothetical protein
MRRNQRRERFLAGGSRLQERARRQGDLRGADRDYRRRSHQHQLAVPRQPRQPMLLGHARQRGDHG